MASELPSELVREIVGHFSRASDMGTIQAASLVSSVFRTPCQEEIFSSVHILRQNRTLLSYIKAVSVKQSPGGHLLLDKNPVESATTELILMIATPAVQKFSFIGWEGETTPEFQSGILTLVRSPHLFSLSLTYATDRLPLALTPDGATISLVLGNSSSFDLDAVKELELGSPCYTRGNILLLIQRCGPSLRRLRFDLSNSLSQLQHLQELVVDEELFVVDGELIWDENPYDVLPSFLGDYFSNSMGFWAGLDSVLANRGRFSKLHKIKLEIPFFRRPKPTLCEWQVKQRGYWSALREAGVVIEMSSDL
ncbi:hypothetical protein BKA70DRAFT_1268497 [Coprinopsis sp. MPI-PUGE-AT-0042]|nr:hypothetical protein BKA70DRAFT_1268497 [Coprinopsis sp. MPI-PUGE-AT-0042]